MFEIQILTWSTLNPRGIDNIIARPFYNGFQFDRLCWWKEDRWLLLQLLISPESSMIDKISFIQIKPILYFFLEQSNPKHIIHFQLIKIALFFFLSRTVLNISPPLFITVWFRVYHRSILVIALSLFYS